MIKVFFCVANLEQNTRIFFCVANLEPNTCFFSWQTWNQTHGFFLNFSVGMSKHVTLKEVTDINIFQMSCSLMPVDVEIFLIHIFVCWIVTVKSRIAAAIATWETTPVLDFQVNIPKLAASCWLLAALAALAVV